MGAIPKVDDQFWFDESGKALSTSQARHNEAAAKVATALIWLWGVYTAAVSVGVTLQQKLVLPTAALLMLVIPIPLLLVGYVCAIWAQVPGLVVFDPRSPTEIQHSFSRTMVIVSRRLKLGLGMAFASAILVSAAIMIASMAKPSVATPTLRVVQQSTGGNWALLIAGRFPPHTPVRLRFLPLVGTEWDKVGDWARVTEQTVLSGPVGDVQITLPVNAVPAGYEIIADWAQDGTARGITTTSQ